ncbi:Oxidoreductase BOA17 [Cladobotryum mycophilum]|uniref:Oxidoreductase BOA17 n=1 Tax=Cladobotryum mycophilum TaxID=491253 RepID=A0ABR0S4G7_9HYPO
MSSPTPVWFITGTSSGFGYEIAVQALKLGHTVIATARTPSRIQALADLGAHTLAFDVTSPLADIQAVAEDVFAKHGRIDYLINTAGYVLEGAVEEVTPEEVYKSFHTNVFGVMNTIKVFLPHIRAQPLGANGVRSTVVTFGSLASWRSMSGISVYSMTKWACSALAECLYDELTPFNIRATVVEPGYFRTGFLNPGTRMHAEARIDAYDAENTPTGQRRRLLVDRDGKQLGDVVKGCKVVVEVLTGTGVGSGKELPVRIVLGSDTEEVIRDKFSKTTKLLDEWSDVLRSTDYPEGQ